MISHYLWVIKIIKTPNYKSGLFSWDKIFIEKTFLSHKKDSFWPYHFWLRWYFIWDHPKDVRYSFRNTLNNLTIKEFCLKSRQKSYFPVGFSILLPVLLPSTVAKNIRWVGVVFKIQSSEATQTQANICFLTAFKTKLFSLKIYFE